MNSSNSWEALPSFSGFLSFSSILKFSLDSSLTSLVSFIPKCFSETIFPLIHMSAGLLLIYRKAIVFLYVNFIFSHFAESNQLQECSLEGSIWSLIYRIMSSANILYFFPICIHFTSLSCLTALAKTSRILFSKSGESGCSVLFLIL